MKGKKPDKITYVINIFIRFFTNVYTVLCVVIKYQNRNFEISSWSKQRKHGIYQLIDTGVNITLNYDVCKPFEIVLYTFKLKKCRFKYEI